MSTDLRALLFALLALALTACAGDSCTPGAQRACARSVDGGLMQSGYQACGALAVWSACVPVGACTGAAGASTPLYSRCGEDSDCGPAGCAVCGHYTGVTNKGGFSVCYPFCQTDAECAPNSAASGVSARCVLGQCTLLCREGATCPRDSQCLPWATAAIASAYPGFVGACE